VVQAVDSLAAEQISELARLFGGPLRIHARRTLFREMTPLEMGRLLEIVRQGLGSQGRLMRCWEEWSGGGPKAGTPSWSGSSRSGEGRWSP
jgi:hypothetical protein